MFLVTLRSISFLVWIIYQDAVVVVVIKGNWSMNNCIHFRQGYAFAVTVPNRLIDLVG
jgi:hypothetical protein